MKRFYVFFFLFIMTSSLFSQVNGFITEINGKKVMKVWGTHAERGYAHGYLLGSDFMDVFDNYIIGDMLYGQVEYYSQVRAYFQNAFAVDSCYEEEAQGVIDGAIAADFDIESNYLGRELDYIDILICNTIPDLSTALASVQFQNFEGGCSSLTSWNEATENTDLDGNLVITRLLDWTTSSVLANSSIMIFHDPSEIGKQPFMTFAFPGMFAALSGINEAGLAVFQNMGNDNSQTPGSTYHPILLSMRNALESDDYNSDGTCDVFDVQNALETKNSFFGAIVQSVTSVSSETPAVVFEVNDENGVIVRTIEDNTNINGSNLAATNHFRTMINPAYCQRYQEITTNVNNNDTISAETSWDILANAAGVPTSIHMIQYQPHSRTIKWAVKNNSPAYQETPSEFNLDNLFQLTANDDAPQNPITLSKAYPNPFSTNSSLRQNSITIEFEVKKEKEAKLEIFNVKGQKVFSFPTFSEGKQYATWNGKNSLGKKQSSGIFFYRLKIGNQIEAKKIILVK